MVILETHIFTRQITKLLDSERYRELQNYLAENPKFGKVIKGTDGLRKIRWKSETKGKKGGIRIIYFFYDEQDKILMIYAYLKSEKDDLSQNQIKILNEVILEEFKNEKRNV